MDFKEFLGQILFPRLCAGCKTNLSKGFICETCLAGIPLHQNLLCAVCHARLPTGIAICHRDAPCTIGSAGPYADPALKELVRRLKFKGVREASDPLADLVGRYIDRCGLSFAQKFLIVPIPLSKRRRNERGFNQAEEIARRLASNLRVPLATDVFTRTRHTKPQTETKGIEERLKNLNGCFSATSDVAGQNILLIDDVTTSGATFREAATALKIAGAQKIVAIAAAGSQ